MKGDHLYVERALLGVPVKAAAYTHHGIDLGDGRVVHFDGEPTRVKDACIKISTLEDFRIGAKVRIRRHKKPKYSREEIARRALFSVGTKNYNLIFNNCEHFATWCVTGESSSKQVESVGRKVLKFIRSGMRRFLSK